jgi:hypothetical protein
MIPVTHSSEPEWVVTTQSGQSSPVAERQQNTAKPTSQGLLCRSVVSGHQRCKVHSRPCPWSARTAVPIGASSPSSPRPPRWREFSTTSASPPSRRGSAQPAARPPGKPRQSMPYQTGRRWPNRSPSTTSTRKCSGSRQRRSPPCTQAPANRPPRPLCPLRGPPQTATSPPVRPRRPRPLPRRRLPRASQRW